MSWFSFSLIFLVISLSLLVIIKIEKYRIREPEPTSIDELCPWANARKFKGIATRDYKCKHNIVRRRRAKKEALFNNCSY